MEDEETLKTRTLISQLSNSVQAKVDDFLSNGVVTTGVVVSSIFLSSNQLFRVEELSVGSSSNFVDYGRFEIEENTSRNVFASTSLREEGVEGIISVSNGFIRGHLSIRLDSVFQAEQLPAGVTSLDTSLTKVNGNNFS